jgi:flagellar hook-associated protein 1 FlgK
MFRNNSLLGSFDAQARNVRPLQEIFNENEDEGLSYAMNQFFNSLADLASTPEGQAERTSVQGTAKSLVANFHMMDSRLTEIQRSANNEAKFVIDEINMIAESIADLNGKIMMIEGQGQSANDFRGQRTQLMSELAEKIDYNYFEDDSNMMTIMVGNGKPLIEGTSNGSLVATGAGANGFYDVSFKDINGNIFDITPHVGGGELHGVLEIRDVTVEDLKTKMDNMAYTFATEFNTVHQAGWSLNGTTGGDFFTPLAGAAGAAAAISVDAAVLNDVNSIAAAQVNSVGDNRNALALAGVQDDLLFNGGTWTVQDTYTSIVAQVGADSQRAIYSYEHQQGITEQIVFARESLAGVSIEEEMAMLMRYQSSYQASARLFNTVGEMVDTLINLR